MPVYENTLRKGPNGEKVWRIVVSSHGRPHETTRTGGTKKQWETFERKLKLDLDAAGAPSLVPQSAAANLLTFSRGEYATHAKAHLGKDTWKVRRFQLAQICGEHVYEDHGRKVTVCLGSLKLTQLITERFEDYKLARLAEGASPVTINTELAKAQAVMTYAKHLRIPVASPKIILLPERKKGRVKFWTLEQLAKLFAALEREAPDLLPIVVFLTNTGCRKGEALACEQAWIDLDANMIRIEPNAYWQPKDGEPREIPISSSLRPWLERAMVTPGKYVFTTSRRSMGREEKTRWACWPKRAFDRARTAAGLVGGPHKLRHTFASHFLKGKPDMFLLAKVLGHSTAYVTELYSHLLPDHLAEARDVVNVSPGVGPATMEARKRWAR